MKLRCLIVDDELLARDRIRALAETDVDLEIIGEACDGLEALAALESLKPDLVFLDVQMPRLDGFGVLAALPENCLPAVVFTTAHDAHAVRAFEVNALDYLLKPFKAERFRQAVRRVREQLALRQPAASGNLSALATQLRLAQAGGARLLIKSPDRIVFQRISDIDWVEAAGNYAVVHAAGERHVIRETMGALEKRLSDFGFLRVSRSAIANLHRLRELQPAEAGSFCAVLKSGARIPLTCSLKDLQQRMAAL